jgi:hypothetical protein
MWERSAQFYIPAVHKSWENYSMAVEHDASGKGVLGPLPPPKEKAGGIKGWFDKWKAAAPLPTFVPKN